MATTNPAGWLQNAGATHTASQLRTYAGGLLAGTFQAGGSATRTRPGVHPALGGQLVVAQNGTPNMSVNVASGLAVIAGSESSLQGMYFCHNDATVNLAIATAPGSGLNRIDLIVAQVQDQFYSGSNNQWQLAVVTGTAASSPSAPSAPNNSLVLAQVFVGANVTSITTGNITDQRQYMAAVGGVIICTSTTRPNPVTNLTLIFESDTGRFNLWNSGLGQWWWPLPRGLIGGTRYTGTGNLAAGVGTTELAINMQSGSLALEANRSFKITAVCKSSVTAAGTTLVMHIRETNVSGTCYQIEAFTIPSLSFGYTQEFQARMETTTARTVNFVITCDAHGGFATFAGGGTTQPGQVEVEDIGPSGITTIQSTP